MADRTVRVELDARDRRLLEKISKSLQEANAIARQSPYVGQVLDTTEDSDPELVVTEGTLDIFYDVLASKGIVGQQALRVVHEMQNNGLYIRERAK